MGAHKSKQSDSEPLISACNDEEVHGFDATGKKSFNSNHKSAEKMTIKKRLVSNI